MKIGELDLMHNFVVVKSLVASVILGIDFLHTNAMELNFANILASSCCAQSQESQLDLDLLPVYESACEAKAKLCAVAAVKDPHVDIVDECVVSVFGRRTSYELPQCHRLGLQSIVCAYRDLFRIVSKKTDIPEHFFSKWQPCEEPSSTCSCPMLRGGRETNIRNVGPRYYNTE